MEAEAEDVVFFFDKSLGGSPKLPVLPPWLTVELADSYLSCNFDVIAGGLLIDVHETGNLSLDRISLSACQHNQPVLAFALADDSGKKDC